jgi:membrane-bound acyltransferase YfiQ involved in biofilm formation
MKSTKIMVAVIASFITTWLLIATFAYLLSSATDFKSCVTNNGTTMFMLIFGWIPSFIVGYDLDKKYNLK